LAWDVTASDADVCQSWISAGATRTLTGKEGPPIIRAVCLWKRPYESDRGHRCIQ